MDTLISQKKFKSSGDCAIADGAVRPPLGKCSHQGSLINFDLRTGRSRRTPWLVLPEIESSARLLAHIGLLSLKSLNSPKIVSYRLLQNILGVLRDGRSFSVYSNILKTYICIYRQEDLDKGRRWRF